MKILDKHTWNRQAHFEFFNTFVDPYFGVTFKVDVTKAYEFSRSNEVSFFVKYLHATMQAINEIENFKYRINASNEVVVFDTIHASATILRPNKTFGFSFINYDENILEFQANFFKEKERIFNSNDLFPPVDSMGCVHCSSLPWVGFTGHKEPFKGEKDSVPKLAFSKMESIGAKKEMQVAISVNHALVDGYHIGLFNERLQFHLNSY
ncbi:CatA-like O-acetyltransferase [Winogradskyella thalassocola]|uniref:Chloramphenicol O-acetyltransferase type A n=1 Tax=Winogradskyella thalassocola TaxID=262004 RepID=A0A1G8CQU5_9FLAO|nr:CatA-like O-acetyltransferase [Winogradskyella thalassocola]SDH47549.1 chloramphenicol O-acetyltransferase type A [Winogradskyella thalassocola]